VPHRFDSSYLTLKVRLWGKDSEGCSDYDTDVVPMTPVTMDL